MHTKAFTLHPSKLAKNLASLHLKLYRWHLTSDDIFQNIYVALNKFLGKNYKKTEKKEKSGSNANDLVQTKNS